MRLRKLSNLLKMRNPVNIFVKTSDIGTNFSVFRCGSGRKMSFSR